jgi:DNA-binding transcriptional ArsR family regulator
MEMREFSNESYYMLFSALANRTRLAIVDALKDGPKTVSEVAKILEQEEDIILQNLKPLVKCALVLSEGSEKEKRYLLNKEIVEPLSELLAFHADKYCPGYKECIPPGKLREYMKAEAAKTTYIEHG